MKSSLQCATEIINLIDMIDMIDNGRLNHKVVTHPASSLAQDRENSLAETSVLTTMLCRQLAGLHSLKIRRRLQCHYIRNRMCVCKGKR